MKYLLLFILFLSSNVIKSQKLSDYKYIYVPQNFQDFKDNKYSLHDALVKKLKSKGYEVLENDKSSWPKELQDNQCRVAFANILKSSNWLTNKITFEAKNCNDKILMSQLGVSSEKDYEIGYNDALQKSLKFIENSAPIFSASEITPKFIEKIEIIESTKEPILEKQVEKVEEITKAEPKAKENMPVNLVENFTNGNLTLQKIQIGNGDFILVSANSSVPFANFKKSFKNDVFHVVLQDGSATLGYLENGNYVIEIPNANGGFNKEIFLKK